MRVAFNFIDVVFSFRAPLFGVKPFVSTGSTDRFVVNTSNMESFGVPDWLILIITAGILLYAYAARNRNYWKKQNVPHEPFFLFFGPIMRRLTKPDHLEDQKHYKKLGRVFGVYEGGKPTLMVGEPDLVKRILVKDFAALSDRLPIKFFDPVLDNMLGALPSEQWRKIRTAVSPAFTTGKLRKMTDLILECVRTTCEHLKEAAEQKKDVDMKEFFGNYGMDVIARCAFGTKLDSHTDSSNEFVMNANKAFSNDLRPQLVFTTLFTDVSQALKIRPLNAAVFQYFKNFSLGIIKKRKEHHQRHEDFLQLMMDAHEGNLKAEGADTLSGKEASMFDLDSQLQNASTRTSKALSEDEALAQCVQIFLAGYDSLSTLMGCAAYELALNPNVQDRLRKEIDECFDVHGENPSGDVISKLPYLHCVVSEIMRLYPPGVRVERTAIVDYQLGDTKIRIPKGTAIIVPVYAMHRDADFFPNPDTFDPERFSDENVASIKPYSYLPFGAGPRNCVGMLFGLQVMKMGLAHSVRSVQFVRTDKTEVPLEFERASVTVLKIKSITVGVRSRPPP